MGGIEEPSSPRSPTHSPELQPRNLHVGDQVGEAAVHVELSDPVVDLSEPGEELGSEPGEKV